MMQQAEHKEDISKELILLLFVLYHRSFSLARLYKFLAKIIISLSPILPPCRL